MLSQILKGERIEAKEPHDRSFIEACRALPAIYPHSTCFHLLGLSNWVPNLLFCCRDPDVPEDDPRFLVPSSNCQERYGELTRLNNLLAAPDIRSRLRTSRNAWALLQFFDEEVEAQIQELGLSIASPRVALRDRLEDKTAAPELAREAGVPVLGHRLLRVENYATLEELSRKEGWPRLAIQLPYGHSGSGTFFVDGLDDYAPHAKAIEATPLVKVAPRIDARSYAIEGCITSKGISASPLVEELIGQQEITPYPGGWCGNQISPWGRASRINSTAQSWVMAVGKVLERRGYRGVFGLDIWWDMENSRPLLGEINARITGITPLLLLAARHDIPLFLHHLAEHCGLPVPEPICSQYGEEELGMLILKQTSPSAKYFSQAPASGIYSLGKSGPELVARSMDVHSIEPGQAFFLRTFPTEEQANQGAVLGRLLLRGAVVDDSGNLNSVARQWAAGLLDKFL